MILSDTPSSAAVGTVVDEGSCTSKSPLTEMSVGDVDKLQSDNHTLGEENRCLKEVITRQALNEKVTMRNTLDLLRLPLLWHCLTSFPHLFPCPPSGLPLFQQYLVVLINLRINIANQHLGYQFGVHHSTISQNGLL